MDSTSSSKLPSASYEEFYGFARPPFTLAPDPRFLYRSGSHAEAITLLLQALRRKEGFVVLTGDIGTGKTTISRELLRQLEPPTFTSLILNPFMSVDDLLREVLLDFGVLSRESLRSGRAVTATTHELVTTLHDFLLSLVPIGGNAVVIIDEAQHLTPPVLEQIRVLSNFETNESKLLQIVLVGELNLLDVLAQADMRQLDQRISHRATLAPLAREEVDAYVGHRVQVAQGSSRTLFPTDALDLVHRYSGGVPRLINLVCDRALMAGAEAREAEISPALVRQAAESLGLHLPAARRTTSRASRWVAVAIVVLALAAAAAWIYVEPLGAWLQGALPAMPARPPSARAAAPATAKPIPSDDFMPPPLAPIAATPGAIPVPVR